MSSKTRRALVAGAPLLIAQVPAAVTMGVVWDRLPTELATRFHFDGTVVDSMSAPVALAGMLVLGLVMALVFGVTNASGPGSRSGSFDATRWFVALSWATAGFLGSMQLALVLVNVDAASTESVRLSGMALIYSLAVAVAGGCVGYLIAQASPVEQEQPAPPPAIDLGATERVSWAQTIGSPWMLLLGGLLVPVGIVLALTIELVVGVVLLVVAVLVLMSGTASVRIDGKGVTVEFSMLRWPRVCVRVAEISEATTTEVSPAQFGGLGYRMGSGGTGVILRSGEALVVTRTSGKRFTVTVSDSETAARVVNGLVARRK